MTRRSLLGLGLLNGIVSALLFASSLAGVAALYSDARMLVTAPYLFTLVLGVVGPVMIGCNLAGAFVASYARRSRHSAQLTALVVAGTLGAAYVAGRIGYAPAADPAWLVRLAFVAALALPWALGAGWFGAVRKA